MKQSFSNFELLIIDDGSTDGTMEFLQSYKDPRIRIFQKQNGGVSLARNFGLQYVCGRYITFIDSDDYILQGFFEDAHRSLESGSDFLIYGGLFLNGRHFDEAPIFWDKGQRKVKEFEIHKAEELFKDYCLFLGNSWTCAKFVKREMLVSHGIEFDEHISYGEDLVFNLKCIYSAQNIALRKRFFYICDISTQSLCRSIHRKEKVKNLFLGYEVITSFVKKKEDLQYCAFIFLMHLLDRFRSLRLPSKEEKIIFLKLFKEIPPILLHQNFIFKILNPQKINSFNFMLYFFFFLMLRCIQNSRVLSYVWGVVLRFLRFVKRVLRFLWRFVKKNFKISWIVF